jgi:serine phosphatase RsbU (regulator of sigma subunit)
MPETSPAPTFVVINPSGVRTRVPVTPLPFQIGRHSDNQLILRDNRISRAHARVVEHEGRFVIEDLGSRHGVWVNGVKVARHVLHNSDRVEFGVNESYKLVFTLDSDDLQKIIDQVQSASDPQKSGHGHLGKLRALVEVARALQSSLSIDEVLTAVVDAALAVTGSERGFLLLRDGAELNIAVARDKEGRTLSESELRVPRNLIHHALTHRREMLSMSFADDQVSGGVTGTIADLSLRSAICVPLVRMNVARSEDTHFGGSDNSVGVIYMDSRLLGADLSSGNRELLQTLALETSTILENARLLEEERSKKKLEAELAIARTIQQGLLPPALPAEGWFRASGSSLPSAQVGGDYYDVRRLSGDAWAVVAADVSGKGVSSALLASLLQGAFLMAGGGSRDIGRMFDRVNQFLIERARGEKYATVFYGEFESGGLLRWANAGHCAPFLVRRDGRIKSLQATGMPVGMLESAAFATAEFRMEPGDKVVIYSDGLTDATDPRGQSFDAGRLRALIKDFARLDHAELHRMILGALESFTQGAAQADDVTVLVVEYS